MIEKEGVTYTLIPLKDEDKNQHVGSSVMLVGKKEFIKTMKEEGEEGFAFIMKPRIVMTMVKLDELPLEIQDFLKEYADIVVEEIPSSLSPIRDISHHIDFILGDSFPNKESYKLTPQQNEEIRRQVQ